jgi:hypothetical protein
LRRVGGSFDMSQQRTSHNLHPRFKSARRLQFSILNPDVNRNLNMRLEDDSCKRELTCHADHKPCVSPADVPKTTTQ